MEYKRLNFEQYFIDTSKDFNGTGKARYDIKYIDVPYKYKDKMCHANYEIHYEKERNVIQINFEQTNGKNDWFVNLMFVQKYYDSFTYKGKELTLKVHNGWARMYKAVKHIVRDKVIELLRYHPTAKVEVIGWSLGSGQAQLCVQDLFYNLGIRSYLYTFGSVNPFKTNIFNRKLTKDYLNDCCLDVYNFSEPNDIVTYLPPRLFGFIKIKRVNVGRKFNLVGLFNPNEYHTHYDNPDFYKDVV